MLKAIARSDNPRLRFLTVPLLLAVAVWPGIAHPEDPPRIEVFTSHAFPVTGLADDGARDVAIYRLDGLAALEAALSVDLPADPEAARAEALRRLGDIDAAQVAHAREAAEGLVRAAEYGISRYPAVVIDGRYLIYGVTHVPEALSLVRAFERSAR